MAGLSRALPAVAGLMLITSASAAAQAVPADVCLEVAPGAVAADEWSMVAAAVGEAVADRSALFPLPQLNHEASRLDISSGHAGLERGYAPCLEPGYEWSARFGRAFLDAGADQMLAEAPTTPGIASEVDIEWLPGEASLRTVLVFAGPLDIPNGTCWIDDALTVADGAVTASGERGLETSFFAEGACRRFYDYLPHGGAGEQAVTLLPPSVELGDGTTLRFAADDVFVREDAVVVAGSLVRD